MLGIRDIVFDSPRPSVIATFWASALTGYQVAPYDEAELARLRANGIDDIADDPTVLVEPNPGLAEPAAASRRPRLFFQLVPEAKIVKNRVHLDLSAADPAAEIARLTELGARVLAEYDHLTTMADPDGNEFCVIRD